MVSTKTRSRNASFLGVVLTVGTGTTKSVRTAASATTKRDQEHVAKADTFDQSNADGGADRHGNCLSQPVDAHTQPHFFNRQNKGHHGHRHNGDQAGAKTMKQSQQNQDVHI